MNATGICTNPTCPRAALGEPVEMYAGPGAYCPDCGDPLTPSLQKPPQPQSTQPQKPLHPPWRRTALLAAGCFAAVAAIAVTVVVGRPAIGALHVRVCSTTATDRVVREVVASFTARHGGWPYLYDVTAPDDQACDVRFWTATAGTDDAVIARDAMVAIVNPGNPVWHITTNQLRDVLSGRITDWSQLGASAGPLVAALPADRSDAASVIEDRVMHGAHDSDRLVRNLAADAIVRVVSSPAGRRSIGIVPFSAAVPAKVLTLDDVAPSTISIADERYPLTFNILVASDFRRPGRAAAALIGFARSPDARPVIARSAEEPVTFARTSQR